MPPFDSAGKECARSRSRKPTCWVQLRLQFRELRLSKRVHHASSVKRWWRSINALVRFHHLTFDRFFRPAGVHSNSHQDLYAECRARTCSITCCSAHKQVSQCSGKRSRHEYVPAANYDESTMISDYMLLEEGVNVQSTLQNGTSPFVTGQNSQVRSRKGAQELLKAALRSSIDLKFMPAGMSTSPTCSGYLQWLIHRKSCRECRVATCAICWGLYIITVFSRDVVVINLDTVACGHLNCTQRDLNMPIMSESHLTLGHFVRCRHAASYH